MFTRPLFFQALLLLFPLVSIGYAQEIGALAPDQVQLVINAKNAIDKYSKAGNATNFDKITSARDQLKSFANYYPSGSAAYNAIANAISVITKWLGANAGSYSTPVQPMLDALNYLLNLRWLTATQKGTLQGIINVLTPLQQVQGNLSPAQIDTIQQSRLALSNIQKNYTPGDNVWNMLSNIIQFLDQSVKDVSNPSAHQTDLSNALLLLGTIISW